MLNDCRLTLQMNFSNNETKKEIKRYFSGDKVEIRKNASSIKFFISLKQKTLAGRFTRHKGGKLYKSTDFLRF